MSGNKHQEVETHKGQVNRQQVLSTAIISATVLMVYLSYLIAEPFLPSLIWALALAVLSHPVYKRTLPLVRSRTTTAAIVSGAVALIVVVPVIFLGRETILEAWSNFQYVQGLFQSGEWRNALNRYEFTSTALVWVEEQFALQGVVQQIANAAPGVISNFVSGSAWALVQMLLTFFALFFFLRDSDALVAGLRGLLPFSNQEIDKIFKRVDDTIYATIFGEILISLITGGLGTLIFYLLGFNAAVMWGFIMALLAFLPAVGTWAVWVPAALYLFIEGRWVDGAILVAWGIAVMTVLTSFLYPKMVGNRLRLNTLAVFIAIIGGLAAFGTVGIIVGPMVLALTISLFEIWRERLSRA